jgi:CRP-like cAMP-binding protein
MRFGLLGVGDQSRIMAREADAEDFHTESAPFLRAGQFEKPAKGSPTGLLNELQQRQLTSLATRVSLPARTIVYREASELEWIFMSSEGALKAFRDLPSGKRRIASFLFPGDLFGLAENGRYVNTVQTITPATLYRIPNEALSEMLRRDPDLQFQFLCKVTHELRQGQRHSIVLARRDAAGRLAMFLSMLEKDRLAGARSGWIRLPMSRTDVAEYLGLSLESVSRATSALVRRGIVTFHGGHAARVVDRARFEKLVTAL